MIYSKNNDDLKKLHILQFIKNEYLAEIIKNTDYKGSKSERKRMIKYLLNIDEKKFYELVDDYRDINTGKNYIYLLNPKIKEEYLANYQQILDNIPKDPESAEDLIFMGQYYFRDKENELKIRLNSINPKRVIEQWDRKKKDITYIQTEEVLTIPIWINFNNNIIIIRCKKKELAESCLKKIFNDYYDSNNIKKLKFSDKDIIKIHNYMTLIRSARLEFENKDVQNLALTAGVTNNNELKDLKNSQMFLKNIKEGKIRNCRYSIKKRDIDKDIDKLKNEDVITLGINYLESTVYFRTQLVEKEVKEWIYNILDQINIQEKFNIQEVNIKELEEKNK